MILSAETIDIDLEEDISMLRAATAVYCICRTGHNPNDPNSGFMISCDGCAKWFHGRCMGLAEEPREGHWSCPQCAALNLVAQRCIIAHHATQSIVDLAAEAQAVVAAGAAAPPAALSAAAAPGIVVPDIAVAAGVPVAAPLPGAPPPVGVAAAVAPDAVVAPAAVPAVAAAAAAPGAAQQSAAVVLAVYAWVMKVNPILVAASSPDAWGHGIWAKGGAGWRKGSTDGADTFVTALAPGTKGWAAIAMVDVEATLAPSNAARALLAEAQGLARQAAATGNPNPMLIQCIDVFAACLRTVAWARCAIACLDFSTRPLVNDVYALTQLCPHVPLVDEVRAATRAVVFFFFFIVWTLPEHSSSVCRTLPRACSRRVSPSMWAKTNTL